jgi:hypothetical protein
MFTFAIDFAHALLAVERPSYRSVTGGLRGITTGKLLIGILTRLSISRCAMLAQAENRKV